MPYDPKTNQWKNITKLLREKKPYEVKNGDILIVKVAGYGFCPKHCEVDHLHTGHKKNYNCKDKTCNHIIYEDRLN